MHDLELWHEPGAAVHERAVLRVTDFVRAAREHGPAAGRLPRPLDLARRLRLAPDTPHSLDAPPHPLERTLP